MTRCCPYSSAFEAVLYFYAAGALIMYMLADHDVTRDELFAVGATFTLVAWAFAYLFIGLPGDRPRQLHRRRGPRCRPHVDGAPVPQLHHALERRPERHRPRPVVRARARDARAGRGVGYIAIVVSRIIGLTVRRVPLGGGVRGGRHNGPWPPPRASPTWPAAGFEAQGPRRHHRLLRGREVDGDERLRGRGLLLRRQPAAGDDPRPRRPLPPPGVEGRAGGVVCDVRGGEFFEGLLEVLEELEAAGVPDRVLFLDADDAALLTRYKETRRRHPLADRRQRRGRRSSPSATILAPLRERADLVVDTTSPVGGGAAAARRQGHAPARARAADGLLHELRLQARPAARRRPDLRRPVPSQPALRRRAAAAHRPRRRGRRVRRARRQARRVLRAPPRAARLPPAAVPARGQGAPDDRHRLHGRAPPLASRSPSTSPGATRGETASRWTSSTATSSCRRSRPGDRSSANTRPCSTTSASRSPTSSRSARFYDAVFFALGTRRAHQSPSTRSPTATTGRRSGSSSAAGVPQPGYGHVALSATGKAAVQAAHAAGLANGGSDDGAAAVPGRTTASATSRPTCATPTGCGSRWSAARR